MNAHASDHDGPIDDGDGLARLCRRDGALLTSWATADHNKVVFGRSHFDGLKSTNARDRSSSNAEFRMGANQ
jgi:hypothetical protein